MMMDEPQSQRDPGRLSWWGRTTHQLWVLAGGVEMKGPLLVSAFLGALSLLTFVGADLLRWLGVDATQHAGFWAVWSVVRSVCMLGYGAWMVGGFTWLVIRSRTGVGGVKNMLRFLGMNMVICLVHFLVFVGIVVAYF